MGELQAAQGESRAEPAPQSVPVGFGHGLLTLIGSAEVLYKASGFWSKSCERSLRWNDPDLAAPTLAEAVADGEVFG